MKKLKKIIMTIGSLAVVTAPIVATVSCGQRRKTSGYPPSRPEIDWNNWY